MKESKKKISDLLSVAISKYLRNPQNPSKAIVKVLAEENEVFSITKC